MDFLTAFFASDQFAPHGYCLMWRPDVFWLHVISDATIAIAYLSIPAAIAVFAIQRRGTGHRWVLWMFGAFVLACGMTHIFSIWTMWYPDYGASGIMKATTALVSIVTAAALWPLLPKAIRIPTVAELEGRVQDRTARLESANAALKNENLHRAQAESQLVGAKNDAEAASRAKSTFLSVMSHELRTPLNAILGYAQLMEMTTRGEFGATNDKKEEYLGHIRSGGEHLLRLIEEILDLSRIEAGHISIAPQAIALSDVIDATLSEVAPTAREKSMKISVDAMADIHLQADPMRLRQVLSNLIVNAVKYNDEGGNIWIRTALGQDRNVEIRVEDDGWGVPENKHHELFQPFARLGRETSGVGGTGIGLALTQRIAELMDGAVRYEARPEAGSTFVVSLPVAAPGERASAAAAEADGNQAAADPVPQMTVLYIEDNVSNVSLMRQIFDLALPNTTIAIALSGAQGLKYVETNLPSLILLDLGLPDMDGFAVLNKLREKLGADMPRVVIVTADATDASRDRARDHGVREFLTKPFKIDDILAVARSVGQRFGKSPDLAEC
jgi:signal transduction histidine kinase/ActR/RegA family two-component response regulator